MARAGRRPLGRAALPIRIVFGEISFAHDAKYVLRVVVTLLHPGGNIAAGGDLPLVNARLMAELFQLDADPERPFAVAAGVADENVRHSAPLPTFRASSSGARRLARAVPRTARAIGGDASRMSRDGAPIHVVELEPCPIIAASALPSQRARRSKPGATARGPWIASSQG